METTDQELNSLKNVPQVVTKRKPDAENEEQKLLLGVGRKKKVVVDLDLEKKKIGLVGDKIKKFESVGKTLTPGKRKSQPSTASLTPGNGGRGILKSSGKTKGKEIAKKREFFARFLSPSNSKNLTHDINPLISVRTKPGIGTLTNRKAGLLGGLGDEGNNSLVRRLPLVTVEWMEENQPIETQPVEWEHDRFELDPVEQR